MSDVTQILSQIESGDPSAAERLLPLVYGELRKLAAARVSRTHSSEQITDRREVDARPLTAAAQHARPR
jgi:hypothetical protein